MQPAKYKALINDNDPVPQVLGTRGGTEWYKVNLSKHVFVREKGGDDERVRDADDGRPVPGKNPNDYLQMIKGDMFWPSSGESPSFKLRRRRYVHITNASSEDVSTNCTSEFFHTGQGAWKWYDLKVDVPAGKTKFLDDDVAVRRVRLRAKSLNHSWDYWDPPIQIAPMDGYLGKPGKIGAFTIILRDRSTPTTQTWRAFGSEVSPAGKYIGMWYSVSERRAFRIDRNANIVGFRSVAGDPFTPQGYFDGDLGPFTTADEISGKCYRLSQIYPKLNSIWYLPKNAEGEVWIYDLENMSWIHEGFISVYIRPTALPDWEGDLDMDNSAVDHDPGSGAVNPDPVTGPGSGAANPDPVTGPGSGAANPPPVT